VARALTYPDWRRSHWASLFVAIALATLLGSCVAPPTDFDAFLNESLGKLLSDTDYDWRLERVGGRSLVSKDGGAVVYRYTMRPSSCSWDVTIDSVSSLVLSWRYPTVEAAASCHTVPAWQGV